MKINRRDFSFRSKYDNVVIHGICMIPDKPIGIFQMVHGMNEHKERYLSFMEYMADKGYVTLMHDNRGHGESVKNVWDIGYCYASKDRGYVEDIYAVTRHIRKEFPGLSLVLYGHSMGSLGVRAFLRDHDDVIDALVVAGCPAYNEVVPLARQFLYVLQKFTGDRFRSPALQSIVSKDFEKRFADENRPFAWLAAKQSVGKDFVRDSLCNFTYTVNGLSTLLNLESAVYKQGGYKVKNPKLPILFISGMEDPCYISEHKWKQAVNRLKKLGYRHIVEKRFSKMRHEIHNEEENERVFEYLYGFCCKVQKLQVTT